MGLFDGISDTLSGAVDTLGAGGLLNSTLLPFTALSAGKGLFNTMTGEGGAFANPALQTPVTPEQLAQQYQQQQDAYKQQQDFVAALGAQNALQRQGDVYGQLLQASNAAPISVAPSEVAQRQLAQATGTNIANQASMLANARGAALNPGLAARLAAQQGANTQQQAIGQNAVLQAQQDQANQQLNAQLAMQQRQNQLAGLQQAGNIAGQQAQLQAQGGQALTGAAQQGYGQQLQAIQNQNQNAMSQAAAQNAQNAAIQKNKSALLGNLLGTAGTIVGGAFGGPAGAAVGSQAGQVVTGPQAGSPMEGLGGMNYAAVAYNGGMIRPKYATGGEVTAEDMKRFISTPSVPPEPIKSLPPVTFEVKPQAPATGTRGQAPNSSTLASGPKSHIGQYFHSMAKGGMVPVLVSPGEKYLTPEQAKAVTNGDRKVQNTGKTFPGNPIVPGDHPVNDTIPTKLKAGGIVIPNSIMQSPDAAKKAAAFIEAILAKKR